MKASVAILTGVLVLTSCSQRRNSATVGGSATTAQLSGIKAEAVDRLNDSGEILKQLTAAPDDTIPEYILARAKCVAVVPSMIKGGFVVGARHGRGVATCRTNTEWSSPAFFTITGGSWGAQIGAQAVDLVMLIMNEDGMRQLLSANLKLGADASIAAGPVGRHAQAATDYKLQSQILTYSRTRGLFAGLTLNGAAIRQDEETTNAFYGRHTDFRATLVGEIERPNLVEPFLGVVSEIVQQAEASR
jgi:lipid-binding SYLF domain-containing protein